MGVKPGGLETLLEHTRWDRVKVLPMPMTRPGPVTGRFWVGLEAEMSWNLAEGAELPPGLDRWRIE